MGRLLQQMQNVTSSLLLRKVWNPIQWSLKLFLTKLLASITALSHLMLIFLYLSGKQANYSNIACQNSVVPLIDALNETPICLLWVAQLKLMAVPLFCTSVHILNRSLAVAPVLLALTAKIQTFCGTHMMCNYSFGVRGDHRALMGFVESRWLEWVSTTRSINQLELIAQAKTCFTSLV